MEMITILTTAAKTVGISPALLIAICTTETNLKNVHTPNDGGSYSYGVCQVKLGTAHFMGKVYKNKQILNFKSSDMKKPENNALIAAKYLKYQLNRYGGDTCKAVAAYNAGSWKESKVRSGYAFNHGYVDKVAKKLPENKKNIFLSNCKSRVASLN